MLLRPPFFRSNYGSGARAGGGHSNSRSSKNARAGSGMPRWSWCRLRCAIGRGGGLRDESVAYRRVAPTAVRPRGERLQHGGAQRLVREYKGELAADELRNIRERCKISSALPL